MGGFKKRNQLDKMCNASHWDVSIKRIDHTGIEERPKGGFEAGKGRFMIFLRQPEQRLLSQHYFKHRGTSMKHMKKFYSGVATKMLTRSGSVLKSKPPTRAAIEKAKIRLQTGFSFIGITEKWDLSMCLFNTMFNQ